MDFTKSFLDIFEVFDDTEYSISSKTQILLWNRNATIIMKVNEFQKLYATTWKHHVDNIPTTDAYY